LEKSISNKFNKLLMAVNSWHSITKQCRLWARV